MSTSLGGFGFGPTILWVLWHHKPERPSDTGSWWSHIHLPAKERRKERRGEETEERGGGKEGGEMKRRRRWKNRWSPERLSPRMGDEGGGGLWSEELEPSACGEGEGFTAKKKKKVWNTSKGFRSHHVWRKIINNDIIMDHLRQQDSRRSTHPFSITACPALGVAGLLELIAAVSGRSRHITGPNNRPHSHRLTI